MSEPSQTADTGGRYPGRGSLVVELPEPVQTADGKWLVAVWINSHRPDTTPSHAVPMCVTDIAQWVPHNGSSGTG